MNLKIYYFFLLNILLNSIIPQTLTNDININLFYIERNKNKNKVYYALKLNKECEINTQEPIFVYWLNLEMKKPTTSPIRWFEKKAYGIKEQTKHSSRQLKLILNALPTKVIYIKYFRDKKSKQCKAIPMSKISNVKSRLSKVYVFAKKKFLIPQVQYIDIYGRLPNASPIKERILP